MTRTGGIIKILPINSHIERRPLARPLSLLSLLQSQWLGVAGWKKLSLRFGEIYLGGAFTDK